MKNPGLAKLPEKVRNNMGFMKDGGEVTANSISDRDRKFLQKMFQNDKSKSANSISNRDVEFIMQGLKKKGFNKGGEVDYEYEDGGEVKRGPNYRNKRDRSSSVQEENMLESIADDIRATMSAQAIQDAIDRQLESETESTPTKDEADAIKKRMRKGRGQTYMGGGMVKYGHGGDVSSGKGCGIATSGRKFSGTY